MSVKYPAFADMIVPPTCPKNSSRAFRLFLFAVVVFVGSFPRHRSDAAESTEESIALYADAANFQTGGAIDLAIDEWKEFLDKYPDDDLAPKAAHYLGVCYMQREEPDYVLASKAFEIALDDKKYDLREESLANLGWCYYASAGDGPQRDESKLRKTIETFNALRKENPKSNYIDRAYFYGGEAAYGLGLRSKAVEMYDKFLSLPISKDSPLLCDALYARGIAQEELEQTANAVKSYEALLKQCAGSELAVDVRLRLGDLMITQRDFESAAKAFDAALEEAKEEADQSYAIFRKAYALVQAGAPDQAALLYDRLQKDFPDSPYAANATLASGQSLYRAGKNVEAAQRFYKVLDQNNPEAATEAAHWLARIHLTSGDAASAVKVARRQLDVRAEGDFAIDLRVDLAEALAMDPKSVKESIEVAEKVFRDAPEDALAPRALYNAAFSSLQVGDFSKAGELSASFLKEFPNDQLGADVQFIAAESQLLSGDTESAIASYGQLLADSQPENPQRILWVLRAATAMNTAGKFDDTISLLKAEYAGFKGQPPRQAEAQFLVAQAHLMSRRPADAIVSFGRCLTIDPKWPRAAEATLLLGTAHLQNGDQKQAEKTWQSMLRGDSTSPTIDQARYKLAQLASGSGDHKSAVVLYNQIIDKKNQSPLLPFALYGQGWSNMQSGNHEAAIKTFTRLLDQLPDHAVARDALIARGISNRTVGSLKEAEQDLAQFLESNPQGTNLGHALYEMALIDQKNSAPEQAAERLARLIRDVPDYPGMDKVLYEYGWSLKESGKETEAEAQFQDLIQKYPDAELAGDAAYFVAQKLYAAGEWEPAAKYFQTAAENASDKSIGEKSYYRFGWSHFKALKFDEARQAFSAQLEQHPEGPLALDATMMIGESHFNQGQFADALKAYAKGRSKVRSADDRSETIRDDAERRVRELILLHGGQSAAQLKQWDDAIGWYEELKERFPATAYLPQLFYESGFAYQQKGLLDRAIKNFAQVADQYRNEVAARARFMIGEIYFGRKEFDKAIPEFQRVMFGFGADKAPDEIKNWQAKSGYEAARCSEVLMQSATTPEAKSKSRNFALQFYQYVVDKHPNHELATQSAQRLEAMPKS